MNVYLLTRGQGKIDIGDFFSPFTQIVVDDSYAKGRVKAVEHAAQTGVDRILVMQASCRIFRRLPWHGVGAPTKAEPLTTPVEYVEFWLYLSRLLYRYAHVYVPPLTACLPWHVRTMVPWRYANNPVIPLVSSYQTKPLLEQLHRGSEHPGYALVSNGYDSFTVDDYFYENTSGEEAFDETGSAATWEGQYVRAMAAALGKVKP